MFFWVSLYVYIGEGNGTPLQYSCLENPMDRGTWKAAVHGVAEVWTWLSDFIFTFHFHALEKEMATHSSVLAWRIPGTGEPGGLPSMGSHRVRHDWNILVVVVVYVYMDFPGGSVVKNLPANAGDMGSVLDLGRPHVLLLLLLSHFSRVWLCATP